MPVITIVLNFSNARWNGAKSLHEMFDIAFLDDEVIECFTSDFKAVAKFFKARRLGLTEIFLDDKISLEHVEAVLHLFEAFTGDNRYWYSEELVSKVKKGGMISMCDLAESIEQKGIKLGELKMLKRLIDNKVISEDEAAGQMNVSVEELTELFAGL